MASTSTETVMDDGAGVIAFVTRLHAAAKAGLKLLESAEAWESNYALGDDLSRMIREARAAYDRLAAVGETA